MLTASGQRRTLSQPPHYGRIGAHDTPRRVSAAENGAVKAVRDAQFDRQDKAVRADHIHPESKGGPTTLDNLQTLCASCNSKKGVRT